MNRIFNRKSPLLLAFAVLLISAGAAGSAALRPASATGKYFPGELLVKMREGGDGSFLARLGERRRSSLPGVSRVKLGGSLSVEVALDRARNSPDVEWAQPNYRYHALQCAPVTAVDSYFDDDGQGWAFRNIRAPQAWALFADCPPGVAAVTVAILDTGVDATNPDLTGAVAGGFNCLAGDASYPSYADPNDYSDDNGHGTFVSGILAAVWGNGGMVGLASRCPLLAVKVLDQDGNGSTESVARGVQEAVRLGARVINLSLAGEDFGPAEKDAFDAALDAGTVVVAAAGNDGGDVLSPASYPPLLAVGAVDRDDQVTWYSNRGGNLDLVAPGGGGEATGYAPASNIFSTRMIHPPASTADYPAKTGAHPDADYGTAAGTSFACPMVSAGAALVLSKFPWMNPIQVEDRLTSTADDLGPAGWDRTSGYGRLNLERALGSAPTDSYYADPGRTFNSPNPFYPENQGTTDITLPIQTAQSVDLRIYDASGALVLKHTYGPGDLNLNPARPQFRSYYVSWDGRNGRGLEVLSGVYPYEVRAGGKSYRNKIVVFRGKP